MSTFTSFTQKIATKIITLAGVPLPRQKILDFFGTGVNVTDDPANGRTRVEITAGGGTTDHGALDGLLDNDHTQYPLRTGSTLSGTYTWTGGSVVVDAGTVTGTNLRSDSGDPDGAVSGALGDIYRDTDDGKLYINTDGATAWSELTPSTAADPSDTAPVPVGGATTIGASTLYMRQDARPDIGVKGANVASAATINLDTATGDYVHVTGTTTITAITLASGIRREVIFDGVLTLTHNGTTLILNTGASATTAAGDLWLFRGEGGGVVRGWKLGQAEAAEVEAAQDTFAFDSTYAGDSGEPADAEFTIVGDEFRFSAVTAEGGNRGLAILSRMAQGGHVPIERVGAPTENLELRVGPPTNEVDYLSFPILDRFQAFHAFAIDALQVGTEYLQLSSQTWQDVDISPDGRHMLLVRSTGDTIAQYYLLRPWKPETGILVNEYVTTALDSTPTSARWSPTGERVYWTGASNSRIFQFDCSDPYQMLGGADSAEFVDLSSEGATPLGLAVSSDETSFIVAFSNDSAFRYDGLAGDPSSFSYATDTVSLSTVTSITSEFHGLHLAADDVTLYVTSSGAAGAAQIHKLTLAGAATLAGATLDDSSADLQSTDADLRGLVVSPDGQYLVLVGSGNSRVYRLTNHALTEDVTYRVGFLPGDETQHRQTLSSVDAVPTYGAAYCTFGKQLFPPNAVTSCLLTFTFGAIAGEIDDEGDEFDGAVVLLASVTTNNGEVVKTNSRTHYFDTEMKNVPAALAATDDENGFSHIYGGTGSEGNFRAGTAIDGSGNLRAYLYNGTGQRFDEFDVVATVCKLQILDRLPRGEMPTS